MHMNISCVKQLFDASQNNSCCMLSMQVPPRGLCVIGLLLLSLNLVLDATV